ncbi:MAG: sugar phosphate isomerase/epimerase family protein, partial [Acidimicrobiales bacterium]
CYQHGGPSNQTAEKLRDYLDAIDSPWVGSYFDIGNHQKYGKPAEWIRTLGKRIVKLDVKDWGKKAGFCKIGDGDVEWGEPFVACQFGETPPDLAVATGHEDPRHDNPNRPPA